ncbi:MAG: flagellar brake protein [Peptococcaceae bacterium]
MLKFLKINSIIEVEVESGAEKSNIYRTRVEDLNEDGFVIGMPIEKGILVPLYPDSTVIVWHWDNSASYAYYCKVKTRIFEPIPLVFLDWPHQVKKVQRRNFVRIPINITIEHKLVVKGEAQTQDNKFIKSLTRDLSGGGTQFISKIKYNKGDILEIKLHLYDDLVCAKARVMWVFNEISNDTERFLVGIKFMDISEKTRDSIIKFVFAKQRELIKKGVL